MSKPRRLRSNQSSPYYARPKERSYRSRGRKRGEMTRHRQDSRIHNDRKTRDFLAAVMERAIERNGSSLFRLQQQQQGNELTGELC